MFSTLIKLLINHNNHRKSFWAVLVLFTLTVTRKQLNQLLKVFFWQNFFTSVSFRHWCLFSHLGMSPIYLGIAFLFPMLLWVDKECHHWTLRPNLLTGTLRRQIHTLQFPPHPRTKFNGGLHPAEMRSIKMEPWSAPGWMAVLLPPMVCAEWELLV